MSAGAVVFFVVDAGRDLSDLNEAVRDVVFDPFVTNEAHWGTPDEGRVDSLPSGCVPWQQGGPRSANRMSEQDGRMVSIVDDDASLRRSLGNLLMSAGLRVETFESAEVFLESGSLDNTGCLVLDLQMPGMGGLGLLKRLTDSGTRVPIIILTAHGDDDMRQRTLQVGATAFLEKPVRGPALLQAIRSALGAA
jgi:CheY-like chemotaxis protein